MTDGEVLDLDDPDRIPLLYRVMWWPLAALHATLDFVVRYWCGRPWFLLPSAIPAMCAAMIALSVGLWVGLQSDQAGVSEIAQQLKAAEAAKDHARQRICLLVLMQRSPKSLGYRFQYALLLRESGDLAEGQRLLENLAADDAGGYRPAHRLLADEAMTRYGEATDPVEKRTLRRIAIRHWNALGDARGPQLDYRLGMLYAEDGQLALGELQLKRAAEAGYGAAQMMLSRLKLMHGDPEAARRLREKARKTLEDYVAVHPEDLEARITWARCLLDGEEWNGFAEVLSGLMALETDADYRDRLGSLALAAAEAQSLASPLASERAIKYTLSAFALLRDRRVAAWRLQGFALSGLAIPPQAISEVRQWLGRAIAPQAEDASLLVLRGRFAELASDLPAAGEAYERAAQLDPNFLTELASFHRRQNNADKLADVGRQVTKHFERRLADKPADAQARAALAEAYADQGRWEQARQMLDAADKNPQLRIALAALCVREFDTALAAASSAPEAKSGAKPSEPAEQKTQPAPSSAPPYELLRTALQNVPGYGPAFVRLENELYREGAAGRKGLHQFLLELLANGEQPAVIHRLLGLRASALKDWPTAVRHFEQAIRLVPNDAFLLNNLAYSLLQAETSADKIRRAESLATEALQLAPEHPEILATRGEIRVRLKHYQAAVADLEKTLAAVPRRTQLQLLLAHCYEQLGMTALANTCREKARQAEGQGREE